MKKLSGLLCALLLMIFFWLAVSSALQKSPTFDEGFYISRGWAFWKTGQLFILGHPPLNDVFAGVGLLLEPNLPDPTTLDGWRAGDSLLFSRDLLWNQGINIDRLLLLARLPFIWLGMLLGALVWRWAREDYGLASAATALSLYVLSPNILAHTRLAATDMGVAVWYVASIYTWMQFLRKHDARWLLATSVVFGLAQASKFSAILLIPTLFLMTIAVAWRNKRLPIANGGVLSRITQRFEKSSAGWLFNSLLTLSVMGLLSLVALWAGHLFTLRPLADDMYIGQFSHFLFEAADGHRAYLLGRFARDGWWYYHLVTLAVKLPIPTLILLSIATALAVGRRMPQREWYIIFPALFYLGVSLLSSLNVGIRYLLPILPLLFLFSARVAAQPIRSGWLRPVVMLGLLMSLLGIHVLRYPDYISFFNMAAGGPSNGYRIIADSNVDWGQDLPALADYLNETTDQPVFLSYFGQADPTYYGIDYIALPAWPPEPDLEPFYPLAPEPGLYAISVSNLLGLQLFDTEAFGYFRNRQPQARVGNSIFIYRVEAADYPFAQNSPLSATQAAPQEQADVVWFTQCYPNDDVAATEALTALSGLDAFQQYYIDCRNNLPVFPGVGWLLLPADIDPVVDIGPPDYISRTESGALDFRAWQVDSIPAAPISEIEFPAVNLPLPIAANIELLGYETSISTAQPGDSFDLRVWWRIREPPEPGVSLFAHMLNSDGTLAAGADALGVVVEDWEPDLMFVQQHTFQLDEAIQPGTYTLTVGLYSTATGERFPVSETTERTVDRVVLRNLEIEE